MAMEHVLSELKAAIECANQAKIEYDTAKAKVNETANQQTKKAEELAKKEKALKEIESILGPALNSKQLLDQSLKVKAEAEAAMKELRIRSEAFAAYSQSEEKRVEAKRRDQEKQAAELNDKAENITQREINLERLVIEKVQRLFPHQKIGG